MIEFQPSGDLVMISPIEPKELHGWNLFHRTVKCVMTSGPLAESANSPHK
jgi:hypothetical protein